MSKSRLISILKSFLFLVSIFALSNFLLPGVVYAICPVCTVAVGAGLGISRALGIDDAVTSVWIGGLILSMSFWLVDWLRKKKKLADGNRKMEVIIIVAMYLLTLLPLYFSKYIGRLYNDIFGIDKILFGTFWGSAAFMFGKWADGKVRQIKGKQLFIYQKVVFPVISLLLTSLIIHFIV